MKRKKNEPLGITCESSDCVNGLHCFKPTKKMYADGSVGTCRECGTSLISWDRIQHFPLTDPDYIFFCLKMELWRHHFWHVDFDQRALNYALRKGTKGLLAATENRLISSLPPHKDNPFDGRQTSLESNPIYYAQHATATCCRNCIEYWYGIPKNDLLDHIAISSFSDLIMKYFTERLPTLSADGIKVPAIRNFRK